MKTKTKILSRKLTHYRNSGSNLEVINILDALAIDAEATNSSLGGLLSMHVDGHLVSAEFGTKKYNDNNSDRVLLNFDHGIIFPIEVSTMTKIWLDNDFAEEFFSRLWDFCKFCYTENV